MLFQKKNDPPVCGGSTDSVDSKAPQTIESKDLIYLNCSSSFVTLANNCEYRRVFVYAAKVDAGALCCVQAGSDSYSRDPMQIAIVSDSILKTLADLAAEGNLVRGNGSFHNTAGLPENFGGSVTARYASGEYISKADNQSPVIAPDLAASFVNAVKQAIRKDTVKHLPKEKDITGFRYEERCSDGAYHIIEWGENRYREERKFKDLDKIFTHDLQIKSEDIASLLDKIDAYRCVGWAGLAERKWDWYDAHKKTLTLFLKKGDSVLITEAMDVPQPMGNLFFDIEMAATDIVRKYEKKE